ncbi:MAG: hypothetical protein QOI82_3295, partial [Actinomycetota bacterium]|nr:hypothetical protein [Actinomycetota bacterium]
MCRLRALCIARRILFPFGSDAGFMKIIDVSSPASPLGAVPEVLTDAALMAQIVAASADAIFSEDLTGRITSWNPGAERLYRRGAGEMLGRSTSTLIPDETSIQLMAVHAAALSGERVERFDTWHVRPDGSHVPVSLTVSPLRAPDRAIIGLATSVKDVSERTQHTAELAEVHRTLEKQYLALGRSNRDLEQFAYVASHDLAEP